MLTAATGVLVVVVINLAAIAWAAPRLSDRQCDSLTTALAFFNIASVLLLACAIGWGAP